MNYSKQREIIHNTLKENVIHPSAEQLYAILQKDEPTISMATLYRNLNKMAEKGIIKKIDGLEPASHYDHNTFEHYHFICDNCKKVFDVPSSVAPDLINKTEIETGFKLKGHDIVFNGLCKSCLEKNNI
ncbi:MAG: transcriptional repressor [Candidatus Gastranaerophilales bacterium]